MCSAFCGRAPQLQPYSVFEPDFPLVTDMCGPSLVHYYPDMATARQVRGRRAGGGGRPHACVELDEACLWGNGDPGMGRPDVMCMVELNSVS